MPEKTQEITMENIKGIIAEATKDMTFPQIEALKAEIADVNRKAIFPAGEGDLLESQTKSIIDTSFFRKQYPRDPFGGAKVDGKMMGEALQNAGGPFLRLSPIMERFAHVLRCRGRIEALMQKGINLNDYNKELMGAECKTVNPLTTTDVGALVPVEYLATIVEFATQQSKIIPLVWRLPMTTLVMKIPKLVQAAGSYFGGVTIYHPDEGILKTDTKPEMDSLTFTAKKMVELVVLTDELIADSSINIINYITGLSVRAFQYQIEREIIQGSGLLGQMLGILNDPGINLVARQVVGSVRYDDFINLESALDENFQNLVYITRRLTYNTLKSQKSTTGQPVWTLIPPPFSGFGSQFNEYPVLKTRNVPAMGVQGDVICGDLGFYIWALRQDMTIDTSRDWLFPYDETAVRFVMRMDGAPGVSEAFSILDNVPES
ncbi:MAG: phage major capsid protein [Desulfobacterales bacterium]|nr:phage major capsid protein [Desulfobacterales bacterium]